MPLETVHMSGAKAVGGNGSSDFKATPEELRTIQERMKDPTFVKLMHEYMESLSDPETRAEEEAYLEQAEREAKEGGDYTFDFIFPRPSFVVQLANPTTKEVTGDALHKLTGSKEVKNKKVTGNRSTTDVHSFINICHSEKVEPFTENSASNPRQSHWHVPVAVSNKRLEYYYENKTKPKDISPSSSLCGSNSSSSSSTENAAAVSKMREAYAEVQAAAGKAAAAPLDTAPFCYVYDAVFHEHTLSLANRSNRFMCFLIEIAVEQINAGYKESNGFEFSRLPSAILCVGYPQNQTIRKKGSASPFAVDPLAPVLTKPTKNLAEVERTTRFPSPKAPTTTKSSPILRSTTTTTTTTMTSTTSPPAVVTSLPPFHIKHRGHRVDFSDTWKDHRVTQKKVGVPEILVVSMDFSCPPVDQQSTGSEKGGGAGKKTILCSSIDVMVTSDGTGLQLTKTAGQPYYEGLVVLPFSVEEDPLSAKFDKQKRVLSLELKVQAHHHLLPRSDAESTSSLPKNPGSTAPLSCSPSSSSPTVSGMECTVPAAPLDTPTTSSVVHQEQSESAKPEDRAGVVHDTKRDVEERQSCTSFASVVPAASSSSFPPDVAPSIHVDATVAAAVPKKEGKKVGEVDREEQTTKTTAKEEKAREGGQTMTDATGTASLSFSTSNPSDPSSSSIPRPPSPSVFSKDPDRVRLMFAKVEEARRAREEALASAVTSETEENRTAEGRDRKDDGKERSELSLEGSSRAVLAESTRNEAHIQRTPEGEVAAVELDERGGKREPEEVAAGYTKEKGENTAQMCSIAVTGGEKGKPIWEHEEKMGVGSKDESIPATEQSERSPSGLDRKDHNRKSATNPRRSRSREESHDSSSRCVEAIKTNDSTLLDGARIRMPAVESTIEREKAFKEMEKQQDAWMKSVQDAISQEDIREVEAAARRARKEAESAKRRYEAVLVEEKLEKKMRAKRAAAPFRNDHIFSID